MPCQPGTCNPGPARLDLAITRGAPHFATSHQSQVTPSPKHNSRIAPPPTMHERNPYRVQKPDFAALADKDEALRPL